MAYKIPDVKGYATQIKNKFIRDVARKTGKSEREIRKKVDVAEKVVIASVVGIGAIVIVKRINEIRNMTAADIVNNAATSAGESIVNDAVDKVADKKIDELVNEKYADIGSFNSSEDIITSKKFIDEYLSSGNELKQDENFKNIKSVMSTPVPSGKLPRAADEAPYQDLGFSKFSSIPENVTDFGEQINPNHNSVVSQYKSNCSNTVVAAEAAMRGNDVQARPSYGHSLSSILENFTGYTKDSFVDLDEVLNEPGVMRYDQIKHKYDPAIRGAQIRSLIQEEIVKNYPTGSRGLLSISYDVGGHAQYWIKDSDEHATIYEMQHWNVNGIGTDIGQFNEVIGFGNYKAGYGPPTRLVRLDNLKFTDNVKKIIANSNLSEVDLSYLEYDLPDDHIVSGKGFSMINYHEIAPDSYEEFVKRNRLDTSYSTYQTYSSRETGLKDYAKTFLKINDEDFNNYLAKPDAVSYKDIVTNMLKE